MKTKDPWVWFMICFGMFMIMMSPTRSVVSLFSGIIVTLTGVLLLVLKKRKKRK